MSEKSNVVTVKKVDVVAMTNACVGNANGVRKAANNAGKAWGVSVLWLNAKKDFATFDATKDVSEIAEDVRKVFKDEFIMDWGIAVDNGDKEELTSDTLGKNARTGKMMEVLDKNGEIKWSSWEETKLAVSYCGDIAKVIDAGLTSELLVSARSVMGRSEILAKCKVKESAVDTIKRSSEMIENKATELTNATDIATALAAAEAAVKAIKDIAEGKADAVETAVADDAIADAA